MESSALSCTSDGVPQLVKDLFGLNVVVERRLESYDDQNYLVRGSDADNGNSLTSCQENYVLKIINSHDSKRPEIIDAQTRIITHLVGQNYPTPAIISSTKHKYHETILVGDKQYNVRLFKFMPSETLDKVPLTAKLCCDIGCFAGRLDLLLKTCPVADEEVSTAMSRKWNLSEVPSLKEDIHVIKDAEQRHILLEIINQFEEKILFQASSFTQGLIHSDFNECNILVDKVKESNRNGETPENNNNNNKHSEGRLSTDTYNCAHIEPTGEEYRVCGVIDFGDATKSLYLFELAIAIAYAMINKDGLPPMDAARNLMSGYCSYIQLSEWELLHLKLAICARLTQSLVMGQLSFSQQPDNDYILKHANRIWPVLKKLWQRRDADVIADMIIV